MTRPWRLVGAAVLTCAAVLSGGLGCTIPSQDAPTVIDPTTVPFDLLDPDHAAPKAASTAVPPAARPDLATSTVYFVKDKTLVGVRRMGRPGPPNRQLAIVVAALASGPSTPEQSDGLGTAIPPTLRMTFVSVEDGQATVDLTGESGGVTPAESPLAVGQIVLTLTSLPGIEEVRLTRDHVLIEAPLADGSLTSAPLVAEDYLDLRGEAGSRGR